VGSGGSPGHACQWSMCTRDGVVSGRCALSVNSESSPNVVLGLGFARLLNLTIKQQVRNQSNRKLFPRQERSVQRTASLTHTNPLDEYTSCPGHALHWSSGRVALPCTEHWRLLVCWLKCAQCFSIHDILECQCGHTRHVDLTCAVLESSSPAPCPAECCGGGPAWTEL
jgi:hypothetical protein